MPVGELVIRSYVEADESQVLHLWHDVFPGDYSPEVPKDAIRRKLAVQRELFLVGECEGQVIATVLAGYDGHRGCFHLVAVAQSHRGQGVGRALLHAAEQKLREAGCAKVNLQVRTMNREARAFYEKLGYCVEQEVCMGKRLS